MRELAYSPEQVAIYADVQVRARKPVETLNSSYEILSLLEMPLRSYLMAIAIFANEVKGKSMLALSCDLGT